MRLVSLLKNPFDFLKAKRNVAFDFLKLIALLSVILDHSLQRWIENSQYTQLYNFIFLFQMPAFMFVAGFFVFRQHQKINSYSLKDSFALIAKKVLCLFVPFISFAIIKSLVTCNYQGIYLCFLYPQKSLWFLWSLMWMEIMMFVSQLISIKLFKLKTNLLHFFCLILYCVFLSPFVVLLILKRPFFDSKLICYYSLFFIAGYLYNFWFNCILSKKILYQCIIFFSSLICVVAVMIAHGTIIFDEDTFLNLLIRMIGSLGAVLSVLQLSILLSRLRIIESVSKIGRLSLEFYYCHLLLLLIPVFQNFVKNPFIFVLLYTSLVVITFASILLLKTNAITDFICFGKITRFERKEATAHV